MFKKLITWVTEPLNVFILMIYLVFVIIIVFVKIVS